MGYFVTEVCILISFIGAAISYQIAVGDLLKDVPGLDHTGKNSYIWLSGALILPLMWVKDLSYLSPVSLVGLVSLVVGVLSIYYYGSQDPTNPMATGHFDHPIPMSPQSGVDFSIFLGVTVYCFDLSTFTFPIQSSLQYSSDIMKVIRYSALLITAIYMIICIGIPILYANRSTGIHTNILEDLPQDSVVAAIVRITMVMVRAPPRSLAPLSFPLTRGS